MLLPQAISSALQAIPNEAVEVIFVPNGPDEAWKKVAESFKHDEFNGIQFPKRMPMWPEMKESTLPQVSIYGFSIMMMIFFLAWKFLVQPACGANFFSYTCSIAPPFIATFFTVLVGIFFVEALPKLWGVYVSASVFCITYLIFSYLFNRELLYLMRELLTPLLGKKVFR